MLGFLKRDIYLQAVNAGFYLCFVMAFALFSIFSDFSAGFASMYLVIFSGSSIMSLFSYDDANHWDAYAAATPNGRRDMVNARYILVLLLAAVVFLLQMIMGIFQRSNLLETALLYAGALLLYGAVVLPIFYRFGGNKSRIIIIVVIAVFSILVASCTAFCTTALSGGPGDIFLPSLGDRLLPTLVPLTGLVLLGISNVISRAIMAHKEL